MWIYLVIVAGGRFHKGDRVMPLRLAHPYRRWLRFEWGILVEKKKGCHLDRLLCGCVGRRTECSRLIRQPIALLKRETCVRAEGAAAALFEVCMGDCATLTHRLFFYDKHLRRKQYPHEDHVSGERVNQHSKSRQPHPVESVNLYSMDKRMLKNRA